RHRESDPFGHPHKPVPRQERSWSARIIGARSSALTGSLTDTSVRIDLLAQVGNPLRRRRTGQDGSGRYLAKHAKPAKVRKIGRFYCSPRRRAAARNPFFSYALTLGELCVHCERPSLLQLARLPTLLSP